MTFFLKKEFKNIFIFKKVKEKRSRWNFVWKPLVTINKIPYFHDLQSMVTCIEKSSYYR